MSTIAEYNYITIPPIISFSLFSLYLLLVIIKKIWHLAPVIKKLILLLISIGWTFGSAVHSVQVRGSRENNSADFLSIEKSIFLYKSY